MWGAVKSYIPTVSRPRILPRNALSVGQPSSGLAWQIMDIAPSTTSSRYSGPAGLT